MKTLLLFILVTFVACTGYPRKFRVFITNGKGWESSQTYVDCDSVTMINKSEAILYVDGQKSHIYAERIFISN